MQSLGGEWLKTLSSSHVTVLLRKTKQSKLQIKLPIEKNGGTLVRGSPGSLIKGALLAIMIICITVVLLLDLDCTVLGVV